MSHLNVLSKCMLTLEQAVCPDDKDDHQHPLITAGHVAANEINPEKRIVNGEWGHQLSIISITAIGQVNYL